MDTKNGCDLQVNHNVYSYSAVIAACHKGYQWFLGNVPTFLAAFFLKGSDLELVFKKIHSWWGGANPQGFEAHLSFGGDDGYGGIVLSKKNWSTRRMELVERLELDKIHDKTTLIIVQIVPTGSDPYCWLQFIDSVEIPFLGSFCPVYTASLWRVRVPRPTCGSHVVKLQ